MIDLTQGNQAALAVDINCKTMRLMILAHLIQQVDDFDVARIGEFKSAGLDAQTINRMRSMTTSDLVRLAQLSRNSSLQIKVNTTNLVSDMNRYEHLKSDVEAFEYFVRHGAPINLVMDLFAKRPADIKRTQAMLEVKPLNGRPPMPDDDTRMEIWACWEALRSNAVGSHMLREHYMELHHKFPQFTFATLDAVIQTLLNEVRFLSPERRRAMSA